MLNTVVASIAIIAWTATYGIYFARDIRRWWRTREQRRFLRAAARERAVRAYAAWVQNMPPPRPRAPIMPAAMPMPEPPQRAPVRAAPARTGVVVPFPAGRRVTGQ